MGEHWKDMALQLVLAITDARVEKKLSLLLQEACVPMQCQFRGQGTANSELLRLCGLGETERILTMWVLPRAAVFTIFDKMNETLQLRKRGHGIAVSIPLTGIQMNLAKMMNVPNRQELGEKLEEETHSMVEKSKFSLIIVMVNQGFSDEVIDAAKAAGAKGGTIIRGRRRGMEDVMKFWEISLQEEREIVLIIVPKTIKKEVMAAVEKAYGLRSPAYGILLSVPVEEALGLEM